MTFKYYPQIGVGKSIIFFVVNADKENIPYFLIKLVQYDLYDLVLSRHIIRSMRE